VRGHYIITVYKYYTIFRSGCTIIARFGFLKVQFGAPTFIIVLKHNLYFLIAAKTALSALIHPMCVCVPTQREQRCARYCCPLPYIYATLLCDAVPPRPAHNVSTVCDLLVCCFGALLQIFVRSETAHPCFFFMSDVRFGALHHIFVRSETALHPFSYFSDAPQKAPIRAFPPALSQHHQIPHTETSPHQRAMHKYMQPPSHICANVEVKLPHIP
jgi:hypothetical protein